MISPRLPVLLVLLVNLLQVWGATIAPRTGTPGSAMTYASAKASGSNGGGFWYQQVLKSTATSATTAEVKAAALAGFNSMKSQAEAQKKPVPVVTAALFIPSKGYIVATSLKAVGKDKQSVQTCSIIPDANHRNYANCAEMNVLAIALNEGWAIPASGAKMATYGTPTGTATFISPCKEKTIAGVVYPGCGNVLSEKYKSISLVTRDETSDEPGNGWDSIEFVV